FMVTIEGFLRSLLGVRALFGNHVIVRHDDGTCAAYADLREGSVVGRRGVRVEVGDKIVEGGNTGNSSVTHLHVQVMDRANPHAAAGLTILWCDIELNGEIDDALKGLAKSPTRPAVRAMPRNGEIFRIDDPYPPDDPRFSHAHGAVGAGMPRSCCVRRLAVEPQSL